PEYPLSALDGGASGLHPFGSTTAIACRLDRLRSLGGYSAGDPPLPIPNRAVKPCSADGTARKGGRVGRRQVPSSPVARWRRGFLRFSDLRVGSAESGVMRLLEGTCLLRVCP